MRTLSDYLSLPYRLELIEDYEEGGFAAAYPELPYSGQFKLRIPRSLHKSLAEHARREGVSMNQYCVYLLSRNDAVYTNNQ